MDLDIHRCWVSEKEQTATFPLYTLSGQMKGFQQYRPDKPKMVSGVARSKLDNNPRECKYFTYRNKDSVSVWGLESWNLSNVLFVTEGIFDACRMTNVGMSAIALLSNNPSKDMMGWINTIKSMRPVVAICDWGDAGRKLAKAGHEYVVIQDDDLGAASRNTVEQIKQRYLHI